MKVACIPNTDGLSGPAALIQYICLNMRLKTFRWLAIALASATLLQAAHATDTFTAYDLNITFTNETAGYWSVNGAPTTTGTSFLQITPVGRGSSVQTDDSGKITGTGMLQVAYNQAGLPYSVFTVTYSGQISAPTGAPPVVRITIKGPGYTDPHCRGVDRHYPGLKPAGGSKRDAALAAGRHHWIEFQSD